MRFNFIGRHPGKSFLFLLTTEILMKNRSVLGYVLFAYTATAEVVYLEKVCPVAQSEEPLD